IARVVGGNQPVDLVERLLHRPWHQRQAPDPDGFLLVVRGPWSTVRGWWFRAGRLCFDHRAILITVAGQKMFQDSCRSHWEHSTGQQYKKAPTTACKPHRRFRHLDVITLKRHCTLMESSKRATVYLDPSLHKALRIKAAETDRSLSALVNEAVRRSLVEDAN